MISENMYFKDEEEMRSAMYGSDKDLARSVTEAVLRDKVSFGEKPEDEPEESVDEHVEVPEETFEPFASDTVHEEKDISVQLEEQNRKLKDLYAQKAEEREAELARQIAERDEKIRIYEESQKRNVEENKIDKVVLDDEDEDLASTYSRNTRKLMEAELEAFKSKIDNPALAQELAEIKAKLAAEEEKNRAIEEDRRAEESRKRLYESLNSFAKGKKEYELPVHVSEAVVETNDLKDKIGEVFNTDEPAEIEKIYRRVIKEDSVYARDKRAELLKAGVALPAYAKNYLNIVEVYELQRGRKFNVVAGVYEDAVLSLEDAYKLNNFSTLVSKAGSTEAKEIQKKLEQQQTSAVTMSNADTSDAGGGSAYTTEEILTAIRMNATDLVKNKVLSKKYTQYLKDEGLNVPPIFKNF